MNYTYTFHLASHDKRVFIFFSLTPLSNTKPPYLIMDISLIKLYSTIKSVIKNFDIIARDQYDIFRLCLKTTFEYFHLVIIGNERINLFHIVILNLQFQQFTRLVGFLSCIKSSIYERLITKLCGC